MPKVRPGLDVLLDEQLGLVRGKRVGVITSASAITSNAVHIVDAMLAAGVRVTALFGPEHGIRGHVADGEEIGSEKDADTGIQVHSLYGAIDRPTPEMLEGVDILVYDAYDIGGRFYTFIYTMCYCMEAAAQNGKPFIVLDRPNPVKGTVVDGKVLEPEAASGIGRHPIPDRHGMTLGEMASMFNETVGYGADLHVVKCQGWRREMWFDETGLPWVMPSPNIATPDSALAFTITCMIEGTNCSEGRGICRPFEIVGAPFVKAGKLADYLNALDLPGVRFRPAHFIPLTSKHQGKSCNGIQTHFMDRDAVQTVRTGLHIIKGLHDLHPGEFEFREPNESGINHFDLVAGTTKTRAAITAGVPADEIYASYQPERDEFMELRRRYLLYE